MVEIVKCLKMPTDGEKETNAFVYQSIVLCVESLNLNRFDINEIYPAKRIIVILRMSQTFIEFNTLGRNFACFCIK